MNRGTAGSDARSEAGGEERHSVEASSEPGGLSWTPPGRDGWVYDYHHRRMIKTSSIFEQIEVTADRKAELIFRQDSSDGIQVSMSNILDTGHCGTTTTERPLDKDVYPIVAFDFLGRITETSSRETFPLIFSPELGGLREGGQRAFEFEATMKSGFSKRKIGGTAMTHWETSREFEGRMCAILVTTFDLRSRSRQRLLSVAPPRFSGRTTAHFDIEAGRLTSLVSNTQLTQTIGWKRLRQDLEMSLRFAHTD